MTIFTWSQQPVIHEEEFHFRLLVNKSIPVGMYTLNVSEPCSKESAVRLCDVNVMFNPRLVERDTSGDHRVRRQANSKAFMDEYLNNNNGFIWIGNRSISWKYAVGSEVVKESINRLKGLMSPEEKVNNVMYSRALTRVISEYVLEGQWGGNYGDGIDPSRWVGSEGILRQLLASVTSLKPGGERVKYGQC